MEANRINPIIIPAHAAVLLCFLPNAATRLNTADNLALTAIVNRLEQQLPASVRMLRIDEGNHLEVVRSFNVSELPAFILVQEGVEQWRGEGVHAIEDLQFMSGVS